MLSYRALTLLALALPSMAESVTECVAMSEIYTDGADLVERMWGGAFECVADEDKGFTMWHFEDDNNPNDAVSELLGLSVPTECEVEYYHKTAPSPGACFPTLSHTQHTTPHLTRPCRGRRLHRVPPVEGGGVLLAGDGRYAQGHQRGVRQGVRVGPVREDV